MIVTAYVLIELRWLPGEVFVLYRRRFGIECSYRAMHHTKAVTTSRNPAVRFFLLGLAFLLENLWVRLRHTVARVPGPGPRRVRLTHFPLRRFITFLARAIEQRSIRRSCLVPCSVFQKCQRTEGRS